MRLTSYTSRRELHSVLLRIRSFGDGSCRDRPEAFDRCSEVAAPILSVDDRSHTITVVGRLTCRRIKAAEAGLLCRLLCSSLALVVEELAIATSTRRHGILLIVAAGFSA